MTVDNTIYAIKGGIPSVGYSPNPDFYLLCYDFNSNIGYIEQKQLGVWKLYTRHRNLLKQYQIEKKDKFYYQGNNFQDCINKLQEITGSSIKVLTSDEVVKQKKK